MKSTTSKRLRSLISDKGITQQEFSTITGIPKSTVSMYFNGKREPRQDVVGLIAKKFGVAPAWVMGYDVPMTVSEIDPKGLAEMSLYIDKLSIDYIKKLADLDETQKKIIYDMIEQMSK